MKVALTITKGPEQGRVIEFTEPRGFVIGRSRGADVCIPDDPYVSRRHLYLEICPPRCRLRDLGSPNPAHVNGRPVVECELGDGDLLEIGYTELRVTIALDPTAAPAACAACGASLAAAGCPSCRPAPAPSTARPAPARCALCSADVGMSADRDGRAGELADVAWYACDRHMEAEDGAPASIGDYALVRTLGEGAMGVVYLAHHRPTRRVWALKRIRDLTNDALVKRFEREIGLMETVVHPNVVRCIETGVDAEGVPYLVTEYMAGGSLEELVLQRGGRLGIAEAVAVIADVLAGLEALHRLRIVHRDVKPLNILLRDGTAKLADFGIAKSYARAGGMWRTSPGTRLGTLMFMPPEQVLDAGAVGETADVYAAGVTLYYVLTGRYSFDFPGPAEAAAFQRAEGGALKNVESALHALMRYRRVKHPFFIILDDDPVPIRERDRTIPRPLAAVVDRAVRKDARERFPSAAEFRRALAAAG